MTITFKTNHQPRPLVAFHELPDNIRRDFDYVKPDDHYSTRFVQYRGVWYDVGDAQYLDPRYEMANHLPGWHGFISDSYFSGVVFKYTDDSDESVICGRYCA